MNYIEFRRIPFFFTILLELSDERNKIIQMIIKDELTGIINLSIDKLYACR